MADPDLHESAWRHAKRDSAGVYRSSTFALSMVVLGLLAAAVAGIEGSPHDDPETRVLLPLAFGLGAVVIGCSAVLVFEIAVAPYRQRDELRQAWVSPEPLDLGPALLNLRRRGRDLLTELGTPDFSLGRHEVEAWTAEVAELLSDYGDRIQAERFLAASDGERGLVPALESRLAALDEIVQSGE